MRGHGEGRTLLAFQMSPALNALRHERLSGRKVRLRWHAKQKECADPDHPLLGSGPAQLRQRLEDVWVWLDPSSQPLSPPGIVQP